MTPPCTQEPLLEIIAGKLDKLSDKVDLIQNSIHNVDIRVTKIETTQKIQKDYVQEKSKKLGKLYGTLSGAVISLIIGLLLQITASKLPIVKYGDSKSNLTEKEKVYDCETRN